MTYSRPQDLRLPSLSFINDERDGNLCDLQYQGDTYRLTVASNRDMRFDFAATLSAVSHLQGGPDAASILAQNAAFWTGHFNGPPPLNAKGDAVSFDIDGLEEAMEAGLCTPDREDFLGHARSVGSTGKWSDRTAADAYLIPVSITTYRDDKIIVDQCLSCGGWTGPTVPTISIPQGEVRIEIKQKVGLEREAFDVALGLTPNVAQLDHVSVVLHVTDADGADKSALFYEIVTQQTGLSSLTGGTVTGPVGIGWQLVPSSVAGGLQPEGQSYRVSASISYEYQGSTHSYDTPAETITVLPMPKLVVDYEAPYVVMAGKPAKIRVRVTNTGHGPANGLTIASAQPQIVDNPNGVPVSFAITGSSPTGDPAGFQPGEMTISFPTIPPGATVDGYWELTTTRHGYFVDFSASLKHLSYQGVEIDPLIESVTTKLVPAIGGAVTFVGCTIPSGVHVQLWQGGARVADDAVDDSRVYFIPDLLPGDYEWRAVDSQGQTLQSAMITVLADQPTAHIDHVAPVDPDSDHDGLDDCWEIRYFHRLDYDKGGPEDDPDADGLSNADEQAYGTDPTLFDTDGDGVSDKQEIDQGSDPLDGPGWTRPPERIAINVARDTQTPQANAIIITHGWNASATATDGNPSWLTEMAQYICHDLGSPIVYNDVAVDGPSRICTAGAWDVWVWDWQTEAGTGYVDFYKTPSGFEHAARHSYNNAKGEGDKLADLFSGTKDYRQIHLIAHSAGSNLIDQATDGLKSRASEAHRPQPTIHTTSSSRASSRT